MACVTYVCNDCGNTWAGKTEVCPVCESGDFFSEFDEEGDHDY